MTSALALRPTQHEDHRDAEAATARRKHFALLVIAATQLMVVLDATIVNVALPKIQTGLHFSPTGLSWVLNAYTLAFGGLLLLGARAGDILGRRRMLIVGISLFTLASLAGGFATSAGWLLAARVAQGVGGALASPSALALLTTNFKEGHERTRALGLYAAVSVAGSGVGLIAGGMLTAWASWRWVLFVNVPIGVAIAMLAPRFLDESPRRPGRFDLTGALTSTLAITALVYGFIQAATRGWSDVTTLGSLGIGVALLGLFIVGETRAEQPITPLRLFADRDRVSAYVARLLLVGGMTGMFFFLTQFMQNVLDFSPLQTGFGFLPITAALFVVSQTTARKLIPRFGAKPPMVVGAVLTTSGMLWLAHISPSSSYLVDVLGPLLLFGIGAGLAFVPLTMVALAGVGHADAGAASGLVNVMQQVGGSLGLAILVTVFGTASRHAASHVRAGTSSIAQAHHVFAFGTDHAFIASSVFTACMLVVAAFAIKSRGRALQLGSVGRNS